MRVAPGQPCKARCQILAIEGQARHAALSDQTAAIEHQQIVIGLVIALAVGFDVIRNKTAN